MPHTKAQKTVVVCNNAIALGLKQELRGLDSLKSHAKQNMDFVKEKFKKERGMSYSTDEAQTSKSKSQQNMDRLFPQKSNMVKIHSDENLQQLIVKNDHKRWLQPSENPRPASANGIGNLSHSYQILQKDIYRSIGSPGTSPQSSPKNSPVLEKKKKNRSFKEKKDMVKIETEKDGMKVDRYPVSSSMKIADNVVSFEAQTGKSGLKAWMGVEGTPKRPSLKKKSL